MSPPGDCLMSTIFSMKADAHTHAEESDSSCRRDNRVNRVNLKRTARKVVTVVTVDAENCDEMQFLNPRRAQLQLMMYEVCHKCFCVTLDKSNRTFIRFEDYKKEGQ